MGTFGADANGEVTSGMNHKGESTKAAPRDGTLRSSEEVGESRWSEGGVCSEATSVGPTRKGRSLKDEAKPFCISRWEVWEAYLKVKSNQGAAGLDEQSIEDFERNLKKNLYRIWNRMSSGSYFPPPVRTVKIPKADGGERPLGIPTVSDRIAQMVVKNRLEAVVDPLFLPASYGYRPKKSALECGGAGAADVLGLRLGLRPGHQGLLRQSRSRSDDAGGKKTRERPVDGTLHRALVESASAR
jgi:hypothetical protein